MQQAINNSYGDASEYWMGIGFVTLFKCPKSTVTKYHELNGLKQSKAKLFSHSRETRNLKSRC